MTTTREKKAEKTVNKFLKDGVETWYPHKSRFTRIESAISTGIPDISFAFEIPEAEACEGWIESKSVALPARFTTRVLGPWRGLSQEQINFHYFAKKIRARSFIFVRAGSWKWLLPNTVAENVNDMCVPDLCGHALVSVDGNWTVDDWRLLIEELTK